MKYVNEPFVQNRNVETVCYGSRGEELNEKEVHKKTCYAKSVTENDKTYYYVCTYNSSLMDPNGAYAYRNRKLDTKMRKCNKETFDLYVTYLKTNNGFYLSTAGRALLNGI